MSSGDDDPANGSADSKYPWEGRRRALAPSPDEPYQPLWAKRPGLIAAGVLVALAAVAATLFALRPTDPPTTRSATEGACGIGADRFAKHPKELDLRPEVVTNEPGHLAICRFSGAGGKVEVNLSSDRAFACGALPNEQQVAVTLLEDDACVVDVVGPPAQTVIEAHRGSTVVQVNVEGIGASESERESLGMYALTFMLLRLPSGFSGTGVPATVPSTGTRAVRTNTSTTRVLR